MPCRIFPQGRVNLANSLVAAWRSYRRRKGLARELTTLALGVLAGVVLMPFAVYIVGHVLLHGYVRSPPTSPLPGPWRSSATISRVSARAPAPLADAPRALCDIPDRADRTRRFQGVMRFAVRPVASCESQTSVTIWRQVPLSRSPPCPPPASPSPPALPEIEARRDRVVRRSETALVDQQVQQEGSGFNPYDAMQGRGPHRRWAPRRR